MPRLPASLVVNVPAHVGYTAHAGTPAEPSRISRAAAGRPTGAFQHAHAVCGVGPSMSTFEAPAPIRARKHGWPPPQARERKTMRNRGSSLFLAAGNGCCGNGGARGARIGFSTRRGRLLATLGAAGRPRRGTTSVSFRPKRGGARSGRPAAVGVGEPFAGCSG